MEDEIFGLDFPPDARALESARPGFVWHRDAAGLESGVPSRSLDPKPSVLVLQLSRICFATGFSRRELVDARAGPALHP
jgi:hypothetical protein